MKQSLSPLVAHYYHLALLYYILPHVTIKTIPQLHLVGIVDEVRINVVVVVIDASFSSLFLENKPKENKVR